MPYVTDVHRYILTTETTRCAVTGQRGADCFPHFYCAPQGSRAVWVTGRQHHTLSCNVQLHPRYLLSTTSSLLAPLSTAKVSCIIMTATVTLTVAITVRLCCGVAYHIAPSTCGCMDVRNYERMDARLNMCIAKHRSIDARLIMFVKS